MFENKIPNTEMVKLSKDEVTYLNKEIKNSIHSLHYLSEMINGNNLNEDMKDTMLTVLENILIEFNISLKRESRLVTEQEERTTKIRTLNMKVRELENELAKVSSNNLSPNYITSVIKQIHNSLQDKLRNKKNGVSGLIDINIKNEYRVEIEFKPMLDSYTSSFSKTPETDKENHNKWINNLKEYGFELNKDFDLLLTDNNILLLENKIKEVLPQSNFTSIRNWTYKNDSVIKSISFNISLEDLINDTK